MTTAGETAAGPTGGPARLGTRPGFDGLRGTMLLVVVAYHAHWPVVRGGEVALYAFFSLSGFLITTLLLEEHDSTGQVSLAAFFARRALRLLPALVVLVLVVSTVSAAVLAAGPSTISSRSLSGTVPVLLYYGNWVAALSGFEALGAYLHTWSLSVEEQFYAGWALLVVAALAAPARRARLPLVAAGALLGTAAAVGARALLVARDAHAPRLLYGTDVNLDHLLLGCALAVALHAARRRGDTRAWERVLRPAVWPALAVVAAWVLLLPQAARALGTGPVVVLGTTAAALSCAALVGHLALLPTSPVTRALSWRPLTRLGRVSYGVYLWHVPVIVVLQRTGPQQRWLLWPLELVVPVGLAALSWVLVERRALARKDHLRRVAPEPPAAVPVP